MNATLVAVALSLVSAVAYAAAAVAQERLAARDAGTGVRRMLASGAWWSSVALNAGAALLHVVALKYGPLTVVQPLGALTLVAAVPLGARLAGRRVGTMEWRGTALTLVGLAAILVTWILATVGFGAALLSRLGLKDSFAGRFIAPEMLTDEYLWATPQFGVPAVTRPKKGEVPPSRTPPPMP